MQFMDAVAPACLSVVFCESPFLISFGLPPLLFHFCELKGVCVQKEEDEEEEKCAGAGQAAGLVD
jgi:hypothetical protein